jgi:glycosyltransferase involved in cell wall biosynthesis
MKIAIVHDDLLRRGGAEQVALSFQKAFPDAPIYTLSYNPNATYSDFKKSHIITSWFQRIGANEAMMKRLFFPLGIFAMQSLKIEGYDIVLMSTTYCAKYVNVVGKDTKVICYCHHPFRIAWFPESYSFYNKAGKIKRKLVDLVLGLIRKIDYSFTKRVDHFIANTSITKQKIALCYDRELDSIEVIRPSVDCSKFYVSDQGQVKEYYLLVSRLEYYKKVDIAISAFNEMGLPLIIVGTGTKEMELKRMAKSNITFLSNISTAELAKLYSESKAFIFPQLEDYGITALEANASGRPIIAYGQGGVLDTTIPYASDDKPFTSLFFHEQSANALIQTLGKFQEIKHLVNPEFVRGNAQKFDITAFIHSIQEYVHHVDTK